MTSSNDYAILCSTLLWMKYVLPPTAIVIALVKISNNEQRLKFKICSKRPI